MSTLLAFDTSTEQLGIAACAHGRVWRHEAVGGALASATLIPSIMALLKEAGIGLADLDAIAFGRGPGAFTGLRTACAVAQGLAFGAGKPVLPIATLLAVAEDARAELPSRREPLEVWAVIDARMDEVYAACHRYAAGAWSTLEAPMLTTPIDLNARWQSSPPEVVAGNALQAFGPRLVTGSALRLPAAKPDAGAMLPLAHALLAAGGAVEAALALPLYLRDKVAQTTVEREQARADKLVAAAPRMDAGSEAGAMRPAR